MNNLSNGIRHIPGLNGIRTIAVFMVIVAHRFPSGHLVHVFPLGNIGVDVFFVLSGYLISRILFQELKHVINNKKKAYNVLRAFYMRRILRIFPLYYAVLLFLFLTKSIIGNNFEDNFFWYFFYCSNYLVFFENKWFGALAHLWSLSVEEQFYLFWPLLILIFRKRIFLLTIMLVLIGSFYPFFFNGFQKVLTIGCLNAFGIGGLFAYFEILNPKMLNAFIRTIKNLCLPAVILIGFHFLFHHISFFSVRLATSIVATHFIILCRFNYSKNFSLRILDNKVMSFIGKISYGIYLFHNIIPRYWRYLMVKLKINAPSVYYEFNYIEFILQTGLIVLISYLSWRYFESPILKFKRNFKY